jgi:hypothetical protein
LCWCLAHVATADREGDVLDYVQFNKLSALNGSLIHGCCPDFTKADAVSAQEAVHMYPFDFAPQCEASAPSLLKRIQISQN